MIWKPSGAMRLIPALALIATLTLMHFAAGGAVVREIPVPAPTGECPRPVGVTVGETTSGKYCAVVMMTDGTQWTFCSEASSESHSHELEGSRG